MRLQKFWADFVADIGDIGFRLELGNFENEFARERITVGVQTGGRKREKRVAGLDTFSSEQIFSLDCADDESRKIVFTGLVEARHFRGFAPDESTTRFAAGAAHAIHQLLDDVRIHLAERQIIQKKERLGALHQNVVHAVIDEIATDGGMNVHGHGDFQLGADAIGTGNKNRLLEFLRVESEERAKAADAAEHSVRESARRKMADALLGFIRYGDVDSCVGVFHGVTHF